MSAFSFYACGQTFAKTQNSKPQWLSLPICHATCGLWQSYLQRGHFGCFCGCDWHWLFDLKFAKASKSYYRPWGLSGMRTGPVLWPQRWVSAYSGGIRPTGKVRWNLRDWLINLLTTDLGGRNYRDVVLVYQSRFVLDALTVGLSPQFVAGEPKQQILLAELGAQKFPEVSSTACAHHDKWCFNNQRRSDEGEGDGAVAPSSTGQKGGRFSCPNNFRLLFSVQKNGTKRYKNYFRLFF